MLVAVERTAGLELTDVKLDSMLDRLKTLNEDLLCVVHLTEDRVLERARLYLTR